MKLRPLGFLKYAVLFSFLLGVSLGALAQGGTLWAWGDNTYGQLGNASYANSAYPVATIFPAGTLIKAVSGGHEHTLMLDTTGAVWACGHNNHGQLGNGGWADSNVPIRVTALAGRTIKAISGGGWQSLALDTTGAVWAWGRNDFGDLGNGSTGTDSNVPVPVIFPGGTVITAIAGGESFSMALQSNGDVWTWGYNWEGELCNGTDHNSTNVPGDIGGGVAAIAGGAGHGLALGFGLVVAWGYNAEGELGDGNNANSNVAALVSLPAGTSIQAISAGVGWSSYALDTTGGVWAWGGGTGGQLGNGGWINSNTPVHAIQLASMTAISAGADHCLALDMTGVLWAWGGGTQGQLGNGGWTNSSTMVAVSSLMGTVQAISGGGGASSYAITGCASTITLSPSSLPSGAVGTAYSQTITATGGTGSYTFAASSGLPPGITLSSGGVLSGTPTTASNYNFTVTATDTNHCTGSKAYALTISQPCPTITLGPATLPNVTPGVAYNQSLTASGGTSPYAYAVASGSSLPTGFTLSSGGTLYGTTTVVGSYTFTVTATDANHCTGSKAYSLTVVQPCPTITLSPAALPNGTQGAAYNQSLAASGGVSPYAFAVASGSSLPAGLTLSSGGSLSGTPTAAGGYTFTVTATDANHCTGSQAYSLTIIQVPPPVIMAILKVANPFRLKITGSNFQPGIQVFIGASTTPWPNVAYKSYAVLVLKSGSTLKAYFPKGLPVPIKLVNPDGGTATQNFTR